ncbi:MAG: efflux RND transporter permease subunit [Hungatella sp.]|jgi:multidrug efflux pump subunit AcrB|nr:efflux RND transporter permease subunit [Hungatella sp.]
MNITKTVLKRPVTTVMVVLCLIVFGLSSVLSSKLELTPSMDMPMLVVFTIYPGASPDDVNELVTRPIEDETGTLTGIKGVTSVSGENSSIVLLEYEYGTDIDDAYDDLKKKMDVLQAGFPDDAQDPVIMEMNINDMASITLAVNNDTRENLYNYVNDTIVPEFEKLSSVASVDISGGRKEYVKIELIPEKLTQYRLSMNAVASAISSADFSFPVGDAQVGGQSLSVSAGVDYDTAESLKSIPITLGNGNIIYLEDVANIYTSLEEASGIGRYNGRDTIAIGIKKQQSSSDVEVSRNVMRVIGQLQAGDPNLEIVVVDDNSEMIKSSLTSVLQTMAMAVMVSMVIIFLFFGDLKASLIVGTSIPISILAALIAMSAMGFSLNVITLSSLVLGVGMMVDNSIVMLESCFRSTKGVGFREYTEAALKGSGVVLQSIIGGTLTTCVVFLPMAFQEGMSGQMFKPLGFTIVFCMLASLISAMTIVPLCYTIYRPKERERAPLSGMIKGLQDSYRSIMRVILPKRKTVIFTSILLLAVSIVLATRLGMELITSPDQNSVNISIETRPGLKVERVDEILKKAEAIVTSEDNQVYVDSYMLSFGSTGLSMSGGSAATLTAYLKDDCPLETDEVIKLWKPALTSIPDCDITLSASSMMGSMMTITDGFEVILKSTQYDSLKEVSDSIVKQLTDRPEVTRIHSSLENAAPLIKINIDPIKASAEGLSPVQVAGMINTMLSGTEATTLEVNGNEVSVMVEYPDDEYATLDQVKGIVIPTATGASVALSDIGEVVFQDSPLSIMRSDKEYQVTITGDYTDMVDTEDDRAVDDMKKLLMREVVTPTMNADISVAQNAMDESMIEELGGLLEAVLIAVFLVFVVMAAQFESPKFSIMVMTTIPFALIGSFTFLFVADVPISMPTMLGFLMLVGTVVNNGILYVDTVNQYRQEMDMETALVEAGATRLRPILMTTLTTIVAMIPMCLAYGDAGEMMQGLALVDVGGLVASTMLALLMLPAYYSVMSRRKKRMPVLED